MTLATNLTRRLGLQFPIVQGPFGGGLSTTRLVSAVSNLGGLGSYGAHVLAPAEIGPLAAEIRALTDKPFALNLWVSDHDPGGLSLSEAEFERSFPIFEPLFAELGLAEPAIPERFHPSFEDQVEALLEAAPPAFSFVFGIPSRKVLEACRVRGIVTMGAATTLPEAEALEAAGVEAIVASGFEAGGHRPSFLRPAEDSLIGSFALTQLIAHRVGVPVIAAGGIADGRGLRAALTLGAAAAQVGTAFLACAESGTNEAHRAALFGDPARHTVLTRGLTGRLARTIENRLIEVMSEAPALPPFPVQAWFTSAIKAAALKAGRSDLISLYAGQIAPNLEHRTAGDLMTALIDPPAAAA